MDSAGSVTGWLHRLQDGDPAAMDRVWERYFLRLAGLARHRLPAAHRRLGREEDIALEAMASFWRGIEQGQFPDLAGRTNLWRLLVVITVRKAGRLVRDDARGAGARTQAWDLERLLDREPSPEFAAQAAEEWQHLLNLLGGDALVAVAKLRMEGHGTREIAARLECSPRTVERKLLLIQARWAAEVEP